MNKIILGTVQMGLDYGVNNKAGKISVPKSHEILLRAYSSGIKILDTAESYGVAHKVIGDFHRDYPDYRFKIITKLPHDIEVSTIENRVVKYLEDLEVSSLHVLMFHSFDSFLNNPEALEILLGLKFKGYIDHVGVSVYTNDQIEHLLNIEEITVVQLPFNLLDNVSLRGMIIQQLKLKGKVVHTRSTFLQGLFFKNFNEKNGIVEKLREQLELLNQISIKSKATMEELALGYCIIQQNIDHVIIGVDSICHLESNLKALNYSMGADTVNLINEIKIENLNILNPSLWDQI
jgi:aryl-alcohol dehydrogenase-like predicted oxidoreductase